ncbi:hypothetical protein BH20CHL3_BH20CHL3_08840 [soil metagenome]
MQNSGRAYTGNAGNGVRFGRARWRDLRGVAAIQKASFRPRLAYGLSALGVLRVFPGVVFLVARTDATTVAGCIIGDRHRGAFRIMNLAVAPSARRQGVATALLHGIEMVVPTGDIVLMVEEWNTGAQTLYEREGYARDGVARDYYGRGRHGIRMEKQRTASGVNRGRRIRV